MYIYYNKNQTTLPLEISSFLPQDHLVLLLKKWWIPGRNDTFKPSITPLVVVLSP